MASITNHCASAVRGVRRTPNRVDLRGIEPAQVSDSKGLALGPQGSTPADASSNHAEPGRLNVSLNVSRGPREALIEALTAAIPAALRAGDRHVEEVAREALRRLLEEPEARCGSKGGKGAVT